MKNLCFAIFVVISFILFPLSTSTSAVEMSAGVSTWYTKWVFADNDNMKMDPAFMFGPALSLRFSDNWSIAGVFLYGRFNQKESDSSDGGPSKISRYDSDISLNYNFNRYFKIFGGGKLLAFTWEEDGTTRKHWSMGPGLGLGTTLPITNNIFFLFNVSGTYTKGNHENGSGKPDDKLTETGVNTTAAFAYYIASASTSINLGFRYQYIHINYDKETDSKDEGMRFYGVTLSAVYSF